MLEKKGTCNGCGYQKSECMCGRKKNTSGEYTMYQNYKDFRNEPDYAMTARINRTSSEDKKMLTELMPMDGEFLLNYLERSDIGESQLNQYAINHHLYGTKRVWSCHTSSRSCFICTIVQFNNSNRAILSTLKDIINLEKIKIHINYDDQTPIISLYIP